jgi:hypothetical protein
MAALSNAVDGINEKFSRNSHSLTTPAINSLTDHNSEVLTNHGDGDEQPNGYLRTHLRLFLFTFQLRGCLHVVSGVGVQLSGKSGRVCYGLLDVFMIVLVEILVRE